MESDIKDLLASTIQCVLSGTVSMGHKGTQLQIKVITEDKRLRQIYKAKNINLSTWSAYVPEKGVVKICNKCKKDYCGMDHHLQLVFYVKDDGEECVACASNQPIRKSKRRRNCESEETEASPITLSKRLSKFNRKMTSSKVVLERIDDVAVMSLAPEADGGSEPEQSAPETGGGREPEPSTPKAGGGRETEPSAPEAVGGRESEPSTPKGGGGREPEPSAPEAGGGREPEPSAPEAGGGREPEPSTPEASGGREPELSAPEAGGGKEPELSTPEAGGGREPESSASQVTPVASKSILNEVVSPLRRSSRSTKSRFRRSISSMQVVKTVEEPNSKETKDFMNKSSPQGSSLKKQKRVFADSTASELDSESEELHLEYDDEIDDDDDDDSPDFVLDEKTKNAKDDSEEDEEIDTRVQKDVCITEVEDIDIKASADQSSEIQSEIAPHSKFLLRGSNLTTEEKQTNKTVQRNVGSKESEDIEEMEFKIAGAIGMVDSKLVVASKDGSGNFTLIGPQSALRQQVEDFACGICNKAFSLKRYYVRHLKKTSTVPVLCNTCNSQFHSQKDMEQHQLAHSGVNPFMCSICYRSFRLLKDASKHALSHLPHHERPFICEKCGKGFIEQHSLQEHRHIHADNKPYHCMYCDAKYAVRFLLNGHMKCHGNVMYRCYSCNNVYKTFYSLKEHLAVYKDHYTMDKHVATEKVPKLPKPPKARKRKSLSEIKLQAEIESEQYNAGIDGNNSDESTPVDEASKASGLGLALVSTFKKECLDLIICEQDEDLQANTSSLVPEQEEQGNDQNDQVDEQGNEQKDSQLEVNGKTKTRRLKSKKKVQLKHGCKICFHKFTQKSQLTRHYLRYGKVSYPCGKCEAKFHSKANREQHKLLHDGTHKYECRVCFRSFAFLSRCQSHTSTHLPMHRRPFSCDKCGKSYSTENILKEHMWIHDKKDSKKCGECGRLFRTSHLLKKHMNIHNGKLFTCGTCSRKYRYQSSLRDHVMVMKHVSDDIQMTPNPEDGQAYTDEKQVDSQETPTFVQETQKFVHTCILCELDFKSSTGLERHLKRKHSEPQQSSSEELRRFAYEKYVERVESQKERMRKYDLNKKHAHYQCEECGHSFKRRDSLNRHVLQKHTVPKFVCNVCGKGFHTSLPLKRHLVTHAAKKPFQCPVCAKTFYSELGLKKHMERHDESKLVHSCEICGKGFQFQCWLKEHVMKHTGERPFTCEKCGKGFSARSIFQKHALSHEPKTYECKLCGKMYTYQSSLKGHMLTHGKRTADFLCVTCGSSFHSINGLRRHELKHKGEGDFLCDIPGCGMTFVRSSEMKVHQRSHADIRPFTCPKCNKTFKTNFYLGQHMKIHDSKPALTCKVCGKVFYMKNKLKLHMSSHQGEKHLPCSKCNELFVTQYDLKKHMKQHLTRNECSECQKVFNMKVRLLSHKKVHEGPNRVQCPRCNVFFKDLEHLNGTHLQMCTTDNFCSVCGRKFQSQQSLQSHMGVHTGKRPNECNLCGKAFDTVDKLIRHQELHCRAFPCPKCKKKFKNKPDLLKHNKTHTKQKEKKSANYDSSTFPLIKSLQLVQQYQEEQRRRDALAEATASITEDQEDQAQGLSLQEGDAVEMYSIQLDQNQMQSMYIKIEDEVEPVIHLDPAYLIDESALPMVSSEQVIVTTVEEDSLELQADNQIIMVAMVPEGQ